MFTVTEAWARIDEWLAKHSPATAAQLAPPASPEEIAAAEEKMGVKFPDDLVESLRCHNGADWTVKPLPVMMSLLSVVRIVQTWEMNVEIQDDLDNDEDDPWWHRQWIPFAGIDSDSQIIDMRPDENGSPRGALGVHYHDMGGRFRGWSSLRDYLSQTAEALLSGGEVDGKVAYLEEDGKLVWCPENRAAEWSERFGPLTRANPAAATVVPGQLVGEEPQS